MTACIVWPEIDCRTCKLCRSLKGVDVTDIFCMMRDGMMTLIQATNPTQSMSTHSQDDISMLTVSFPYAVFDGHMAGQQRVKEKREREREEEQKERDRTEGEKVKEWLILFCTFSCALMCPECDSIRRLFFTGFVLCSLLPDVLLNVSSELLSSYSQGFLGIILMKC